VSLRSGFRRGFAYVIVAVAGFMLAYLFAAFVIFPSGGVIPQDATVPAVTGLPLETAETELRRAGFQPKEGETRFHAASPQGTVLEQSPAAGSKLMMGTTVTLAVSGGQASQTIPNVIGLTREDAERRLEDVGFEVAEVEQRSSAQPAGQVIDTRPRVGSSATVPGIVVLVLSSGADDVPTPDVVGLGVEQARQVLANAGLAVQGYAYEVAPGPTLVVSQSPAAGAAVRRGSGIALRVSGEVPP